MADECDSSLPDIVRESITKAFPEYRLPRVSDNLGEDIESNRQHGGDGCLGVAEVDFDGNGSSDYGVLVSHPDQDHVLLVAASRVTDRWRLETLRVWESERKRLYVAAASAGTYRRSMAFDYPVSEPGEVEFHDSELGGLVTGRTEASGIYYFWTQNGWGARLGD